MRIKKNKGRKPIDQPHIHIGDYLLLSRKREKQSKLQFNWTGPYVALAPLTPFIWKIQAIDQSPPIEAHIQRLKRYADSSLMKPLRLIEEVRGEQEQCELDKFIDWRIDQDTLMLELKCRWRGFTEAWDTYEDVESHLWLQQSIRKDILEFLHAHKHANPIVQKVYNRLNSQTKDYKVTTHSQTNGRGRGRSRG